ncbi:MAG: hypothetical protein NC201_03425 [Prevotella sp.]|nr:hypothetical protein [Bacteroides sp.]MCM1366278.1 hypothetical protein [Prevotella sp.]MCM1436318.1 hypothetical protein [Prevotella sp.]
MTIYNPNKIFAVHATILFSIFLFGASSCGNGTAKDEFFTTSDRFPPKPNSFEELQQIDNFYDSISDGNMMMHSRMMYNLTEQDRMEFFNSKLFSDSIPFSETWVFMHWEEKAKYLYEDNEYRWINFEYSVSVIE